MAKLVLEEDEIAERLADSLVRDGYCLDGDVLVYREDNEICASVVLRPKQDQTAPKDEG